MPVPDGTRLGPYQVVAPLGAGGMGEVYRATDSRLKRQVAIKILPAALAGDPDRLARFQREAEVLASLNHPQIAAVYGLEDAAGVKALVMELVEGPTLADRIARGPIALDEALSIARQVAAGLEAAHEQGIIHRDLKPANIKVREDGAVKILDFGLAKLADTGFPGRGSQADPANSPTLTAAAMTGMGMILGTAAYMSPEQARGRTVDKRTDVWAFGAVLYEMLTGTRAFEGEDITETMASVVKSTPNWAALPPDVPPHVVTLDAAVPRERSQRADWRYRSRTLSALGTRAGECGVNPAHASRERRILTLASAAVVVVANGGSRYARRGAGRRARRVAPSWTAARRGWGNASADERAAGRPACGLESFRVCQARPHCHRHLARRQIGCVHRRARYGDPTLCPGDRSRRGDADPGHRERQRTVLFTRRPVDWVLDRPHDQESARRRRACRHNLRCPAGFGVGRELGRGRHGFLRDQCGHLQSRRGWRKAGDDHHDERAASFAAARSSRRQTSSGHADQDRGSSVQAVGASRMSCCTTWNAEARACSFPEAPMPDI